MKKRVRYSQRISYIGLMIALAIILSFVETLIPIPVGIPGIKIGLANMVILYTLLNDDIINASAISIGRVILIGFMFGNFASIIYSFAGAALSLAIMYIFHKYFRMHTITVSICGAVAHILGQMIIAAVLTSVSAVLVYTPILLVAAVIAGTLIGVIVNEINKRIVKIDR